MQKAKALALSSVDLRLWLLGALLAVAAGVMLGLLGESNLALVPFTLAVVLLLALRRDEVTAAVIIGITILIDWYELLGAPLQFAIVGLVIALVLLSILFLTQSAERSWLPLPRRWWWTLLLALAAFPALRGSSFSESFMYYVNIFGGGFLMYLLGVQVARDVSRVRRLLGWIAALGALVGLHSLILSATGTFLLATPHLTTYLVSNNFFRLAGTQTLRAGSFLLNPDWNGAFLAMLLFIPAGLLLASRSLWAKLLYLGELLLLLGGLLVTYSLSSLLAAGIGLLVFLLLVVRRRTFLSVFGLIGVASAAVAVVFHSRLPLLLNHLNQASEFSLRLGGWETALQVIRAHPLGIGLGIDTYTQIEGAYRVPLEYRPLAHPHNAYLELGALAGLPTLLVFLALLGAVFWLALRTYRQAEKRERALLAGALVAVIILSINSLGVNAWTIAPLAAIGWLLLGALTSPALAQPPRLQPPRAETSGQLAEIREREAHLLPIGGQS